MGETMTQPLPPLPEGATLDQPQAAPSPAIPSLPEGATLDQPQGGTPPQAKPGYSLPTSWEDAFHRIMGGGLVQTPTSAPANADGKITDIVEASRQHAGGDVLPNPVSGVLAGAAVMGGGMAADTAMHGGTAGDIVQNGLLGAGAGFVGGAVGKGASALGTGAKAVGSDLVSKIPQKIGEWLGPATADLAKTALSSSAETLGNSALAGPAAQILKTAAQQGPQQLAVAHYLLSQRDPAYAAAQSKKRSSDEP